MHRKIKNHKIFYFRSFSAKSKALKSQEKRCKCRSFLCSNKISWGMQLSITCRSISVIYYLKYNICHIKKIIQEKQLGISMLGSNPGGNHIYPNFEMVIANRNIWHVILVVVEQIKICMNHFQNQWSVTNRPSKTRILIIQGFWLIK